MNEYPEIISFSEAARRLRRRGIRVSRNTISEIVASRRLLLYPVFPGAQQLGLDPDGFRVVEEVLTPALLAS